MYTIRVVFASCSVLWCHGGIALVSFSVLWQLDVRRGFGVCVCVCVHSTQNVPQQVKCYQLKRASDAYWHQTWLSFNGTGPGGSRLKEQTTGYDPGNAEMLWFFADLVPTSASFRDVGICFRRQMQDGWWILVVGQGAAMDKAIWAIRPVHPHKVSRISWFTDLLRLEQSDSTGKIHTMLECTSSTANHLASGLWSETVHHFGLTHSLLFATARSCVPALFSCKTIEEVGQCLHMIS